MEHTVSDDKMQKQNKVDDFYGARWKPLDVFENNKHMYAVMVLNRPLYWKHDILLRFWQKAQVTVTVDGGTLWWLKYLEKQGIDVFNDEHKQYVPNLITGDMDSCSSSILKKLESIGSTVVKTPDQNHTDFTKALLQVVHYATRHKIELREIYVLVETSGRLDHIIGNINTLYNCAALTDRFIQVYHVASNSWTWLLRPGSNKIYIPEILVQQKSWCGLLPFGPVKNISTSGLRWNLTNDTMQFGGLVSTSNTYEKDEVIVKTDAPIIWTMGVECFREDTNDEAS